MHVDLAGWEEELTEEGEGCIDREETDEEGLHFKYDSVIVGTGIIESILACAIQLIPGKRVKTAFKKTIF